MTKRTGVWPKRPKGFYEDWTIFCCQTLSARLQQDGNDEELAVVLLAAGAILGGAGLLYLASENKDTIDAKGREWGIANLSTIAGVGGAVLGATVGGLGVTWLTRTLGRHADSQKVDALQARLSNARREFETLQNDCANGRLDHLHHRLAVERLFVELTNT
ncbi:MAG TPA: hypothetical protein VGM90_25450 [Kofleriaceae bacterium]|jgi:hypothetical protein